MNNKQRGVTDILSMDVCTSTLTHIRNDWSLIFPLRNERLMMAWCEYYPTKPSEVLRC